MKMNIVHVSSIIVLISLVLVIRVDGAEIEDENTVEARGKGKYALLSEFLFIIHIYSF